MFVRDFDITSTLLATSADLQDTLSKARAAGRTLAEGIDQIGRSTWSGATEAAERVAEHGRLALSDTVELARSAAEAKDWRDLVAVQAGYASRRAVALLQAVDEVNAIVRSSAIETWRPLAARIEDLAASTPTRPGQSADAPTATSAPSRERVATAPSKITAKRRRSPA